MDPRVAEPQGRGPPAILGEGGLSTRYIRDADPAGRCAELAGERLRPVVDATTVRIRDRETLASDGPFAETKDSVGGVAILECANLDGAIETAAGSCIRAPGLCGDPPGLGMGA